MVRPITPEGEAGLSALVATPQRALLAFDFDGVLSPIIDDPDLAQPLPGVFHALAAVGRQTGPVVIITGRPVTFLLSRDGFDVLTSIPDFAIYGHYGLERWNVQSTQIVSLPVAGDISAVREELAGLLREPAMPAGAWIEDKGSAVAVHTRKTADPARALALLSEPISEIAWRHQLHVEPGKMVLEIRPPGISKGDVLRELAASTGPASVLYAGDDLGDLSAFAVVDELRATGVPGVKVASGSAEAPGVAEAADLVVDGPPGVRDLLSELSRLILPG